MRKQSVAGNLVFPTRPLAHPYLSPSQLWFSAVEITAHQRDKNSSTLSIILATVFPCGATCKWLPAATRGRPWYPVNRLCGSSVPVTCVLTTRPAFFTASGSPSSPVPMFPFSRWMRVWQKLGEGVGSALEAGHHSSSYTRALIILTRFPPVLRSSRRYVGVWWVLEEKDKAHPFLMELGRKTKYLPRRREGKKGEQWGS